MRHLADKRRGDQLIDVVGEIDQRQENQQYRDDAVQQPLTKFNQMTD